MNYYERIQKAVDYIEDNLYSVINLEDVAKEAFMSLANLYRLFFALTGHTVKEYIRNRRLFLASKEILSKKSTILEIAIKYDFGSHEAFTRAFKKTLGVTPSAFKKQQLSYKFERVNVLDKYIDVQDKELLEKYPEIKVLKELEPFRVAYYCYFGKNPESGAWEVMSSWLKKSGIDIEKDNVRIFGYNNPPTSGDCDEYGYEIVVTIDDNITVNDDKVKTKVLEGGLYAVMSVKGGGAAIPSAWQRFMAWIKDSKYIYGGHQWLEEHLGFDEELNHTGNIDIYMPLELRKNNDSTVSFQDVDSMWSACYKTTGKNAIDEGRDYFFKWAESVGLFEAPDKHRFFAYYDSTRMGQDDFWYEICVSVNKDFITDDENIVLKDFRGGHYATMNSIFKRNGWTWGQFIQWISSSKEFCFGNWQFFEEYHIDKPEITMETPMTLFMPVQKIQQK